VNLLRQLNRMLLLELGHAPTPYNVFMASSLHRRAVQAGRGYALHKFRENLRDVAGLAHDRSNGSQKIDM
jgi:hypothetical protein